LTHVFAEIWSLKINGNDQPQPFFTNESHKLNLLKSVSSG